MTCLGRRLSWPSASSRGASRSRSTTSAGSSGVVAGCGSSAASESASSGPAAPASSAGARRGGRRGRDVGRLPVVGLAAALELLGDEADGAGEGGEERELLQLAALLLGLLAAQLRDRASAASLAWAATSLALAASAATGVARPRRAARLGRGRRRRRGRPCRGRRPARGRPCPWRRERRARGVLVEVLGGVERRRDGRLHLRADLVDVVRGLVEQGLLLPECHRVFLFQRCPAIVVPFDHVRQGAASAVRLATRARIDGHAQRGPPERYPLRAPTTDTCTTRKGSAWQSSRPS